MLCCVARLCRCCYSSSNNTIITTLLAHCTPSAPPPYPLPPNNNKNTTERSNLMIIDLDSFHIIKEIQGIAPVCMCVWEGGGGCTVLPAAQYCLRHSTACCKLWVMMAHPLPPACWLMWLQQHHITSSHFSL